MSKTFRIDTQFEKYSEELGLALGWAIVCKEGGKEYFDLQGDHIPEESMLKAATDFMLHSRVGGDMHKTHGGEIVFAWPMTQEIAEAFGITTQKTGLMIAYKPNDPAIKAKFKSGEYTGSSIGGVRLEDEEVD